MFGFLSSLFGLGAAIRTDVDAANLSQRVLDWYGERGGIEQYERGAGWDSVLRTLQYVLNKVQAEEQTQGGYPLTHPIVWRVRMGVGDFATGGGTAEAPDRGKPYHTVTIYFPKNYTPAGLPNYEQWLKQEFVWTVTHELIHVYQSDRIRPDLRYRQRHEYGRKMQEAEAQLTAGRLPKARREAIEGKVRRLYLSEPAERTAYAANIAQTLRAWGITRIGFPASAQAREKVPDLDDLYDTFPPGTPKNDKFLKDMTRRIAQYLVVEQRTRATRAR